ncbi:MAG: sodium:proton antiporter [Methanosarcinaceae archaeon]|nr:sodium:proton antiporter [Methanosarcinaceae archaeon]
MRNIDTNEKMILRNLKYLNDSVIAILFLMPVTIIISFEALDSNSTLNILSILTWVIYLFGLCYVLYRVFNLNKELMQYVENE